MPPSHAVQDTTASATTSMHAMGDRARAVAAGLADGDPMKRFARGLADDMGSGRNSAVSDMGRMGALRNAHAYALSANKALQGSPDLQSFA